MKAETFVQAWLWWIGLHVGAVVWFADQLEDTEKQWVHALGRRTWAEAAASSVWQSPWQRS